MRTFLFGLLLGAAAGILYAPSTGARTRSLLKDKFTKYSNDTADYIDAKGEDLRNRMEGMRHNLREGVNQAQEQLNKVQSAAQQQLNQAKQDINERTA